MPSLRVQLPGASSASPRVYRLHKRLTTLGTGADNDILLADPLCAESHAFLQCDERNGASYLIQAIDGAPDLVVGGKRKRKHRLAHRDTVRLGGTDLLFQRDEASAPDSTSASLSGDDREALSSYRKLFAFSERLLLSYELPSLLDALMDAVVEVTSADKGFLVLLEGSEMRVKVARNIRREILLNPDGQISDSILEKVGKTRKPLIISDALRDEEFQNSLSVMNLKLSSVMCVPLLEHGNLLGMIYVGNDSVRALFVEKDLEVLTVFSAQAALIIQNALLVNELKLDNKLLSEQLTQMRYGSIIGSCAAMQEVFRKLGKVATTDVSVVITGETGTGKELIAREIHERSPRHKAPLITINCGAIPEHLLESELFGHVRGAFTGAVQNKQGRFQAAQGGTVFLDEIGELPLLLQVKILRVLQEREICRVGDTRSEPVDIRVIAATHRDLPADIQAGRFREDLFYRLNVVQLHLPPLRDRGDDVLTIATYLLHRYERELCTSARGFSQGAQIALRKYAWPGNIRQLENHIKKALILSEAPLLSAEDLGIGGPLQTPVLPLQEARERFQRDYINEVLALNGGNRTKAAKDLGVDPRTIFRYLEKEDGPEARTEVKTEAEPEAGSEDRPETKPESKTDGTGSCGAKGQA